MRPWPGLGRPALVAIADADQLDTTSLILEELGCDVVAYRRGRGLGEHLEVIATGEERPPCLMIVDAELTDEDALGLLHRARRLLSDLPVLLFTDGDEQVRMEAWRRGVTGLFGQPVPVEQLRQFCLLVVDPLVGPDVTRAIIEVQQSFPLAPPAALSGTFGSH